MIYGTSPAAAANPDIKWETSTQTDFGIDMRFLNQRLSLDLTITIKDNGYVSRNAGSYLYWSKQTLG